MKIVNKFGGDVNLAKNIKQLRNNKGWSQTKLAEEIGAHLSHINRLETGKYNPSIDVLMKLASVLDSSLDGLVYGKDKEISEVKIEDKGLAERIRLIDSLDLEDRQALIRVIDSMLTKNKILGLLTKTEDSSQSSMEK